jgi:hypothetical protein
VLLTGGSDDHLSHYLKGKSRFGDVQTVVVTPAASKDAPLSSRQVLEVLRMGHKPHRELASISVLSISMQNVVLWCER